MKKLLGMLLLITLCGCSALNLPTRESLKTANTAIEEALTKEIAEVYKQEKVDYKDDKVYFIYGLEKINNPATNVKYRGMLYSKRLAEMNAAKGLEVGLVSPSIGGAELYNYAKQYSAMFMSIEIENLMEKKAKEIFGEKTTLSNGGGMTEKMYKFIKKRLGKEYTKWEDKNGFYTTIVNVYGEDLEKMNIDEYKQKTFELSKYIYNYTNCGTSLQIFVRDNSYFDNYDLVKYSVYKPFGEREDIKAILNKISIKEKLDEEEKKVLVNNFMKGIQNDTGGILRQADYKRIISRFDREYELPLEYKKNVVYYNEVKNGIDIGHSKEDREREAKR